MEIIDMYKKVFEDCVECYLEDKEEEDIEKITKEDIKEIAYKLVFKSEYMWEVINETIGVYIDLCLQEKERNDD